MPKTNWSPVLAAAAGLSALFLSFSAGTTPVNAASSNSGSPTEGTLYAVNREGVPEGICPLKRTDVNAEVSGFLARVSVTQEFTNDSKSPIEAVYKFPLPHDAAVDHMEMVIGKRVVKAQIQKREDARRTYEQARNSGRRAALLDQERPNLFTQHVANILPGDTVRIHIQYVETLKYEDGDYEFVFPMVVGPRYTPSEMANPEAVTVKRTPEGTRAGHDINIKVNVDAGMSIGTVASPSHNVDVLKADANRMMVALKNAKSIPNKDFVLRYDTGGAKIKDALLTHRSATKGGFFTLILQPPDRVVESEVTPKEIVFVVDTSGSMHGYPMDKVKEVIRMAFDGLHPRDTFNLITFSGDEHILFPKPVPATRENIATAWKFMQSREGRGGTEMMKAIRAALDPSDSQDHLRIVCFMTDGEVGNDFEILSEIRKHSNARVFAFGIGNSVNRYLLDGMSRYGRGETQFVTLSENGSAAAKRFHERVRTPLLTDISIDWNGLDVSRVYPTTIPDLFSAKPLVINGRFDKAAGKHRIRLNGRVAGRPYSREIEVDFAAAGPKHEVLATYWARRRVEELTAAQLGSMKRGHGNEQEDVVKAITQTGLEFRLMTQYTSFVAVEDKVVNEGGKPVRVEVPVEMPEGVSYEGVYGEPRMAKMMAYRSMPASAPPPPGRFGGGFVATDATMANGAGRPQRRAEEETQIRVKPAILPRDAEAAQPLADVRSKIHASLQTASAGTVVRVQVWLNQSDATVVARLKALGFVVETASGQLVTGRIDGGKLAQLAGLSEVRAIVPAKAG